MWKKHTLSISMENHGVWIHETVLMTKVFTRRLNIQSFFIGVNLGGWNIAEIPLDCWQFDCMLISTKNLVLSLTVKPHLNYTIHDKT